MEECARPPLLDGMVSMETAAAPWEGPLRPPFGVGLQQDPAGEQARSKRRPHEHSLLLWEVRQSLVRLETSNRVLHVVLLLLQLMRENGPSRGWAERLQRPSRGWVTKRKNRIPGKMLVGYELQCGQVLG